MALSKELKQLYGLELTASKAALKAHENGIVIHEIVIKAFEEALKEIK